MEADFLPRQTISTPTPAAPNGTDTESDASSSRSSTNSEAEAAEVAKRLGATPARAAERSASASTSTLVARAAGPILGRASPSPAPVASSSCVFLSLPSFNSVGPPELTEAVFLSYSGRARTNASRATRTWNPPRDLRPVPPSQRRRSSRVPCRPARPQPHCGHGSKRLRFAFRGGSRRGLSLPRARFSGGVAEGAGVGSDDALLFFLYPVSRGVSSVFWSVSSS